MRAAIILVCSMSLLAGDRPTVVQDAAAKRKLLGVHGFTCQWVQWGREKGRVAITEDRGRLRLKGEQVAKGTGDSVRIEGDILEVKAKSFLFRGRIVLQVTHLNGGKPCERDGDFDFQIRGGRKFWRMRPMENPCDPPVVDYIDVHF
jgi:hypothetical protein